MKHDVIILSGGTKYYNTTQNTTAANHSKKRTFCCHCCYWLKEGTLKLLFCADISNPHNFSKHPFFKMCRKWKRGLGMSLMKTTPPPSCLPSHLTHWWSLQSALMTLTSCPQSPWILLSTVRPSSKRGFKNWLSLQENSSGNSQFRPNI